MIRFVLLLSLLLTLRLPAGAEEVGPPEPSQISLPGVAELIPRSAELTDNATKATSKLSQLSGSDTLRSQLKEAQTRHHDLSKRITELGPPTQWSFTRLQEIRGLLTTQAQAQKKILDVLSANLAEVDHTRQGWNERERFWKNWQEELRHSEQRPPAEIFATVFQTIGKVIQLASDTTSPLVKLQQDVGDLQTQSLEVLNQIDDALKTLRKQTFKKTTHSYANPDFYRQFTPELWQSVKNGLAEVRPVTLEFWSEQGWIFALQGLTALFLAALIRRRLRGFKITREWLFIARSPFATGTFVAVSSLSFLYKSPPPPWELLLWGGSAFSASALISGMLKSRRKAFAVYLLAALSVTSLTLQIIAFPTPLYRIYLTLVCLTGIPLTLGMAKRHLKTRQNKLDGFAFALRCGAGILLVALLCQMAGFSNLSARLVTSSVNTVYLALAATIALRLGAGGIRYLASHPAIASRSFFQTYGGELADRLTTAFQIFIIVCALLYLPVTWGLYNSITQAWNDMVDFQVVLGEVTLSVLMVVLVLLILYLSLFVSWLLKALLETQIFPYRQYDRGIRDAIKKLLHYSLVFFGFLFAMTLVGLELKNFAVLAGAFGIGIGFGLQNIVNNFVSGIILLFERPVKVGDVIEIDSQWATVREIGLRSTIVETLNRSEIIVPNSDLISQKVTNWTLTNNLARVVVPIGVAYGSDIPLVLQILQESASTIPGILTDPTPSPIFVRFGDSSLDFELRVWIASPERMLVVRSEILQYVERRFREEDIEIPFPQRDLHLRSIDGNLLPLAARMPQKPAADDADTRED